MTYLFTFPCYGMEVGVDASRRWAEGPRAHSQPPYILDARRQRLVVGAIREISQLNHWVLIGVNAQPDVVTFILAAEDSANRVRQQVRYHLTRRLQGAGIDAPRRTRWSREGGMLSLRTRGDLERALRLVASSKARTSTTWIEPVWNLRPAADGLPG